MAPRVYAPNAPTDGRSVDLPDDEAHHLEHVLRLRIGDVVAVFDGAGREWSGRIAVMARSGVTVELGTPIHPVPEPAVHVTLAVAMLKGDQMDTVIRDATMLGVARIVPMRTDHVAVPGRLPAGDKALSRWRRVAVASAKQCGRAVVPEITPAAPLADVLRTIEWDRAIIATEPAAASDGPQVPHRQLQAPGSAPEPPKTALVLVGPEGGWSRSELELALGAGAERRQLGPRTLRAESTPIVLLSALWTEWGWS